MRHLLTLVKALFGISGILVFFYRNHLFSEYSKDGLKAPDDLHKVLVNNHGFYSYITVAQSDLLIALIICAVILFVLAAVVDAYQRSKKGVLKQGHTGIR